MKIDIGKNGNKLVNILYSDKISYKKEKNNRDKYNIKMRNDSLREMEKQTSKYIRPYLQQIFHGNTDYLGYNE